MLLVDAFCKFTRDTTALLSTVAHVRLYLRRSFLPFRLFGHVIAQVSSARSYCLVSSSLQVLASGIHCDTSDFVFCPFLNIYTPVRHHLNALKQY